MHTNSIPTPKFRELVDDQGYVFLQRLNPKKSSLAAIGALGAVEKIGYYDKVHDLTPRDADQAATNSYSGNFGCGEFPFHTDFAHWFVPPRYLVLRCVVGSRDVSTRLLDSIPLVEELGGQNLARALVQPRTPLSGQHPLLRILQRDKNRDSLFRWDSVFLRSVTIHARMVAEKIAHYLREATPIDIVLEEPSDTLVIDNWRILHGRSAIPESQRNRKLHRAYLSALK